MMKTVNKIVATVDPQSWFQLIPITVIKEEATIFTKEFPNKILAIENS